MANSSLVIRFAASTFALAASIVAQNDRAIVATRVVATNFTSLLDVDLTSGSVSAGQPFTDDIHPPLCVTWDPIDDRVLGAVDLGGGRSRLVRVGRSLTGPPFERVIADVPAVVRDMLLIGGSEIVVAASGAGGGLWMIDRNGSTPRLVVPLPHATAMFGFGSSSFIWVVADPPGAGATLNGVDLSTGTVQGTPTSIPTAAGATINGLGDLPTGAFRQVLSDTAGTLTLFENMSSLTPIPILPPLPTGGTIEAMTLLDFGSVDAVTLGGAANPFLDRVRVFGALAGIRAQLAGPLPDAPVDFALTRPLGAAALRFGSACTTSTSPTWISQGAPRIGTTFTFGVDSAIPSTPAFAAFGVSEQLSSLGLLPVTLPFGCALFVSPNFGLPTRLDANGNANLPISIPNRTSILGTTLYAQWVIGGSLITSDAAAIRVGL